MAFYEVRPIMAKIYTAFRCPLDLLAKARIKASADRRSLSNFIVMLLEKDTAGMPTPKMPKKLEVKKTGKRGRPPLH